MDRQISILIIDDDPGACETLSDILKDEGYKVLTLERGLQGVEQIKTRFFNVVLLDINLPDVSGLEVLKAIKKIEPEVCVIMITGYARLENVIEALNEGADAYINKPLNIDEVKLIIKREVERQILSQEKKRLEHQLLQSEKLAGIGILASGIAHEINNPLFGIMGMAEAILEEENLKLIKEHTKDIIKYSVEAAEIVRDLAGYVQTAEAGDFGPLNINEKLNDTIKIARHSTKFGDVKIITDYRPIPSIKANSSEIQQVFLNLINNAVQSMNGKGRLILSTMPSEDYVEIKVIDNGHGIPKGHINKIFDPFFTTKEVGKGTGLGLNIVHRIIIKYKGSIEVESEEGKGTTFTVRFPVKANT